MASWVPRKSLAASGEEIITDWMDPRRMDMIGPYFWESLWRSRCGRFPNKWRLPMIGKGMGPGGSFLRRT